MSVIGISPHPDSISADDESGSYGWLIETNNKLDEPLGFIGALQSSGQLPYRGSGHPVNPFLRSTGIRCDRWQGSKFHWLATSVYKLVLSEKEEAKEERQNVPSPLDRAPKITKTYDRSEVAISKDREEVAILNSAGDPYLDPVVVPRSNPVWHVRVNLDYSPDWMDELADKVNAGSNTIRGRTYGPGTLLFEPGEESEAKTESGFTYYEVSFKLLVDRRGWKERRYHNGLNEKTLVVDGSWGNPDSIVKRKIKLPTKDPETGDPLDYDDPKRDFVSDPQMLDALGQLLENPTPDTAVEHVIEIFEQEDFSVLPGVS